MKKTNLSQNHFDSTNFMDFYCGSYDDKVMRELTHEKQNKKQKIAKETTNVSHSYTREELFEHKRRKSTFQDIMSHLKQCGTIFDHYHVKEEL